MVIDTGIVIEHLRAKNKFQTTFYLIPRNSALFITSVSVYEVMLGATSKERYDEIKLFIDDMIILPFDEKAAEKAAEIYNQLKKANKLIEFRDIFIAAICITNNLPLLTLNKKHFTRINNLSIV